MRVRDIMTAAPLTCGPHTNLAQVAHEMWQGDCGILPVVDERRNVLGVITDRDVCLASATRDRPPSHIRVDDVVHHRAIVCQVDDDVRRALRLMQEFRVRRLPVVGADGTLQGILSLNDIVLELKPTSDLTAAEVMDVFASICAHHHAPVATPAAARKPRTSHAIQTPAVPFRSA